MPPGHTMSGVGRKVLDRPDCATSPSALTTSLALSLLENPPCRIPDPKPNFLHVVKTQEPQSQEARRVVERCLRVSVPHQGKIDVDHTILTYCYHALGINPPRRGLQVRRQDLTLSFVFQSVSRLLEPKTGKT
ncbi:hypothetical protein FGG08_004458 [Glutinoglossum americanum]|uniref:Uncharacterized protein n=1 Tax=Glutinoglossum americanum TaxID=1670608 RepID=A0A9P8KZJ9_9PEZI|nr:hypothetical protein FGG08_004458 [Glutinoglossum americanum]